MQVIKSASLFIFRVGPDLLNVVLRLGPRYTKAWGFDRLTGWIIIDVMGIPESESDRQESRRGPSISTGKSWEFTHREMKLTWKKDNKSKKRPLAAISKYPNLPFDQQDTEDSIEIGDKDGEHSYKEHGVASHEPLNSQSDRQLAESFQAQGNKLAEVFSIFISLSLFKTHHCYNVCMLKIVNLVESLKGHSWNAIIMAWNLCNWWIIWLQLLVESTKSFCTCGEVGCVIIGKLEKICLVARELYCYNEKWINISIV